MIRMKLTRMAAAISLVLPFSLANADLAENNRLFTWAEHTYPELFFPGEQETLSFPGLDFRYYPDTGAYIKVLDDQVIVTGGPFGPLDIPVGNSWDYKPLVDEWYSFNDIPDSDNDNDQGSGNGDGYERDPSLDWSSFTDYSTEWNQIIDQDSLTKNIYVFCTDYMPYESYYSPLWRHDNNNGLAGWSITLATIDQFGYELFSDNGENRIFRREMAGLMPGYLYTLFGDDEETYKSEIYANHINNHYGTLLFSCNYRNSRLSTRHQFRAIIDTDKNSYFWQRTGDQKIRAPFIVIPTMISDLHFKIYKKIVLYKPKKQALSEATRYIQSNVLRSFSPVQSRRSFDTSDYSPGQKINKVFELIHSLSDSKADGNIDVFLSIVANQYESLYLNNNQCNDLIICGYFFKEKMNVVTSNPNFSNGDNGLEDWTLEKKHGHETASLGVKSSYENAEGDMAINLKMNVENDAAEDGGSSINLYQTINIRGEDLKELSLVIESKKAVGNTEERVHSGQFSGTAGYYLTVTEQGSNNPDYQLFFGNWLTDSHPGISMMLSDIFSNKAWSNLYAEHIHTGETLIINNPAEIISENLSGPGIEDNKTYIIQYGATVFEAYSSNNSSQQCDCSAELEISSIKLVRFE